MLPLWRIVALDCPQKLAFELVKDCRELLEIALGTFVENGLGIKFCRFID
jgi:hypothetical protein